MAGPSQQPEATTASVPAQIVKAGGGGAPGSGDLDCEKIFAQFDPPIITGSYDDVRAANAAADNGCQAEHYVPNNCFQSDRGNSASNVPGAGNYSEGEGFCYNAYDDQSQGTEHKFLTDAERLFSQESALEGEQQTLGDWMDKMEAESEEMLASDKAHSNVEKGARPRIKDQSMSPEDKKKLAKAAAKCIRMAADAHYAKLGISQSTPMRNPWNPTKAQVAAKLQETIGEVE